MRRYLRLILSIMTAVSFFITPAFSDDNSSVEAPLSPQYLEWLSQRQNPDIRRGGHIPFPGDLSHLADNPPDESLLYPHGRNKDTVIPSTYDLRNVNGKSYVTSIKNQNPWGTCWAHSAIGAMESNYLMKGGDSLDLSEMHLAYFTFINSDKTKTFDRLYSVSRVLDEGGNSFYPAAIYSRLDGPVLESEVPYPTTPSSSTPESYTRVLRLREVYYLNFSNLNVNGSDTERNIVKRRIMDTGSVVANYYDDDNGYSTDWKSYYYPSSGTATNHAIQIIGWDDNYSRSNFKTNPGMDGAWLIKNSWGENFADGGYMWISYANYLDEGSAFIVESSNPTMKAYYYDPLGWTGGRRGWNGPNVYMANVFKTSGSGEVLTEVGFFTFDNNQDYEVTVYTGLGSSMPSSPTSGTLVSAATTSGTIAYAGYHTVTLNSPAALTQNQYFSVVVKYVGEGMAPTSSKVAGVSSSFTLKDGSFFSQNGSSWTKGSEWKANAPLKAFTITGGEDGTPPSIVTTSLADAVLKSTYTAVLSAYGEYPITWSLADGSSLPAGLTLNGTSGTITGTPTTEGSYSFTVIATNENGSDDKSLTIKVTDVPTITTTSFTGYAGYEMPESVLQLSNNASATWSIEALPKNLKLNASTGAITGKPKTAGEYSLHVEAVTSAGTSTGTLNLTINEKPTKAAIKTSSLTAVTVGETVNQTIEVTGTEPITLNVIEGMPEGMDFDYSTNTFTGAPTVSGKYSIKMEVSNIVNTLKGKDPSTKKIKLVVNGIAPEINAPEALPSGIINKQYSGCTVSLSAGSAPEKWTASGLPKGLSIDASGYIGGIPTKAGTFGVKITAKNNAGKDTTDKIPLTIYAVPEIKTKKLKDGKTDKAYSVKLSIKNVPETVTISGEPSTLSLTQNTKGNYIISGTPTEAGSYKVNIYAENAAGSADVTLPLTIKGVAPKIKASLPKGTTGSAYEGTITITGTKPLTISHNITAADAKKFGVSSLEELGLTFDADESTGVAAISGTPKYAVKGLPVYVTAKNSVGSVTKAVKLKISGTEKTTTTVTTTRGVYDEAEGEDEGDAFTDEQAQDVMTLGETRGLSALTQSEREQLEREGYIIAAVLPEVSVDASGMYDLYAELDEGAETGKVLVWLAFTRNAEGSEDDEIAEFFDEDGREITSVPESHAVNVSVWLNEGVIYAPVIAVKK